nr:hypothetical protein [Rhodococcus sp. (in: high G+C Gram-positive bacteria)]
MIFAPIPQTPAPFRIKRPSGEIVETTLLAVVAETPSRRVFDFIVRYGDTETTTSELLRQWGDSQIDLLDAEPYL